MKATTIHTQQLRTQSVLKGCTNHYAHHQLHYNNINININNKPYQCTCNVFFIITILTMIEWLTFNNNVIHHVQRYTVFHPTHALTLTHYHAYHA